MKPDNNSLHDWAVYYAQKGWAVFPLLPNSKKPATQHGFNDATNSVARVESWWRRNPDYNIGVATGKKSNGLVVIDLDVDEEKGKDGYHELQQWQKDNKTVLPDTIQSITGRGGYHMFYHSDTPGTCSTAETGVDIRADGGYVVVPPSIHPNGRRYEWEQEPGDYILQETNTAVQQFIRWSQSAHIDRREKKTQQELPEITVNDKDKIEQALSIIPAKELTYDEWIHLGMALHNCGMPFESFDKWSEDDPRYDGTEETYKKWKSFTGTKSRWNMGTIFNIENRFLSDLPEKRHHVATVATVNAGKTIPVKKVPTLKFISAKELYNAKLPEIYYPIEGVIPEGETILAAPPKSAKSWMALDMALCVAKGEKFLDFETHKADVLYCSLEDGDKFSQERLHKYCGSEDEVPENFHLIFEDWVPLDEGFMDQLEQARSAFPNLRMVIIDTLAKIQSKQKKGESAYERDYRTGQMLKSWADKHGIAVLVVTHTTKLVRPEDALANVSGTNGVTGVADAVIVIAKEKRTDTDAVLAIDGRRVRQTEHEIKINWNSCRWEYVGIADPDERESRQRERELEEMRNSTAYKAVLKVAEMNPNGWEGGAKKLVNDAIEYGVLVTESPKEVGGMLTNKVVMFAQDGVRVQVMKNGTGANSYKLSAWQTPAADDIDRIIQGAPWNDQDSRLV